MSRPPRMRARQRRTISMQDLPQNGSLSEIYLPRLIAGLHLAGFEGTVRVNLAETTKVVYFRHGDIASAASNAESDRLANILIRDDRLTQAQLELAKARIAEGGSLGKTLIELGFLSPTELLQGARRQVREILGSCFTLSHGRFEVDPGPLPREVTSLGLPTRRLIFDCVLQASERDTVLREVGSMEMVYKPDDDLGPALDVLRLDPEMDRVARSLDGSSSLRDLSGRTALDDFSVSRIVLALEVLGLAVRMGTPLATPGVMPGPEATELAAPLSPEEEAAIPIPAPLAVPTPVVAERRARRIDVTPVLPSPAEPPPIPEEELPAFATAAASAVPAEEATDALGVGDPIGEPEPEAGGTWQIDPETGDRVRIGPVEMTFDGEIVPKASGSWMRPRVLAGAAAVLIVVATVSAFLALRRGDEAGAAPGAKGAPPPTPAPRTETTAQATPPPMKPIPATPTPAPEETATPTPPPLEAPRPVPPVEVAAGPVPSGSASSFRDGDRYLTTLQTLDAGDVAGAARGFLEMAATESSSSVTLQLMVACVEDTVRNARARSGDGGSLFFVPYSLKGRSCYRVCWGVYQTRAEASQGIPAIPDALRPPGSSPVPVPLASLATGH